MTKGPIEALEARLLAIEARAGLTRSVRRPAREGRLRPGGVWLRDRLRRDHPEALDKSEQDMLGSALVCADRGDMAAAQRYLDLLAKHHSIRLQLTGAKSDENGRKDGTSRL